MPNTLRLPALASRLTGLRRLALTGAQVAAGLGSSLCARKRTLQQPKDFPASAHAELHLNR